MRTVLVCSEIIESLQSTRAQTQTATTRRRWSWRARTAQTLSSSPSSLNKKDKRLTYPIKEGVHVDESDRLQDNHNSDNHWVLFQSKRGNWILQDIWIGTRTCFDKWCMDCQNGDEIWVEGVVGRTHSFGHTFALTSQSPMLLTWWIV